MVSRSRAVRFVQCGGWIKQERWSKPKCALAWGVAGAWLAGFGFWFGRSPEPTLDIWNVALVGQGELVGIAILLGVFEKPVLKERLIQNPEKKPHALY